MRRSSKLISPVASEAKVGKPTTALSGTDILRQSGLSFDMKELERLGFGTENTLTISTAPLTEALVDCRNVLSQMDTINSSQISNEVKEIDQSFSNGDFPEKVLSFVEKQDYDKLKPKMFGNSWDIDACLKEDCSQRQQCNLTFTSHKMCIWSVIHCRLNNLEELLSIIKEIAMYMKNADEELGERLENKSF